jgi:hypothetical protein
MSKLIFTDKKLDKGPAPDYNGFVMKKKEIL